MDIGRVGDFFRVVDGGDTAGMGARGGGGELTCTFRVAKSPRKSNGSHVNTVRSRRCYPSSPRIELSPSLPPRSYLIISIIPSPPL